MQPEKKSSLKLLASDGIDLFIRKHYVEQSDNTIILIHGLGEHSGRYSILIEDFNKRNISVFAMDTRGHGQSSGKRGHSPSYLQLLDDIELFIEYVKKECPTQIFYLYGHSMGGHLVINYSLLKNTHFIKGIIATSPALRPAFTPPFLKIVLGKIFQKFIPSVTLNNGLDIDGVSRNADVIKAYENDPLNHDQLSILLGIELLKYGESALEDSKVPTLPMIIFHGKKDRLTSYIASKAFAEKNGSKVEFIGFENAYHEIHNEPEREQLFENIITWINKEKV